MLCTCIFETCRLTSSLARGHTFHAARLMSLQLDSLLAIPTINSTLPKGRITVHFKLHVNTF